jgi:hypothetical protein
LPEGQAHAPQLDGWMNYLVGAIQRFLQAAAD